MSTRAERRDRRHRRDAFWADVHARFNMACAYGVHDFDPEPHPEWPGCDVCLVCGAVYQRISPLDDVAVYRVIDSTPAEWVDAVGRAETRADTRARRATRIPATRAAYARTRRARRHH